VHLALPGAPLGLALALALALAAPAPAGPPPAGVLVPGRSLGGLRLGMPAAQVEAAWGRAYGVCRSCAERTWYFNQYAFRPEGAAVVLRGGRVAAIYTIYGPRAWRTSRGLAIGDHVSLVAARHGALRRVRCDGYTALTLVRGRVVTAIYILRDEVWGFGLLRDDVPVCR
jgi:hypothetical protein